MIPRRKAYMYPGERRDIAKWRREGPAAETVATLERAVADNVGVPGAAAVSSGRLGMTLILEHIGVDSGDEVIIPAYTLKDLVPLIQALGARVVPADVDPETFAMSPDAVAERVTPRTKAIIALHPFGLPCAIRPIVSMAERRGIPVIEDCAHSLGATVQGHQTGSFGYAGFFSFETTKPVNTFGGGMVVSQDMRLLDRVREHNAAGANNADPFLGKVRAVRLERFMFSTRLAFLPLYLLASPSLKGLVERLYRSALHAPPATIRYAPIQAELGLRKLNTLAGRIRDRAEKAALLRELLDTRVRAQRIAQGCEPAWYFFVALLPCTPVRVRKRLLLRGIDAGIEDEVADDCAALLEHIDCPNARGIYSHAIALPLYEGITERAIRKTARVLNSLLP